MGMAWEELGSAMGMACDWPAEKLGHGMGTAWALLGKVAEARAEKLLQETHRQSSDV